MFFGAVPGPGHSWVGSTEGSWMPSPQPAAPPATALPAGTCYRREPALIRPHPEPAFALGSPFLFYLLFV